MNNKIITTVLQNIKNNLGYNRIVENVTKDEVKKKLYKFLGDEINLYFNIKTNRLRPNRSKQTLENEKVIHKVGALYLDPKGDLVVSLRTKPTYISEVRAFVYSFKNDYYTLDPYNWKDTDYEFVGTDKSGVMLLLSIVKEINPNSKISINTMLNGKSFKVL
jgi:hypothetical protein